MVWSGEVWLGKVRLGSEVRYGMVRFGTVGSGRVRLGSEVWFFLTQNSRKMKIVEKFDDFLYDLGYNIVTDETLKEFLGVKEVQIVGTHNEILASFEKHTLDYLAKRESFFDYCLRVHKKMFVRVSGVGFKVLPPSKQADFSLEKFENKMKATMRKADARLRNIDKSQLTHEEKKRATDILNHLSQIQTVLKSR